MSPTDSPKKRGRPPKVAQESVKEFVEEPKVEPLILSLTKSSTISHIEPSVISVSPTISHPEVTHQEETTVTHKKRGRPPKVIQEPVKELPEELEIDPLPVLSTDLPTILPTEPLAIIPTEEEAPSNLEKESKRKKKKKDKKKRSKSIDSAEELAEDSKIDPPTEDEPQSQLEKEYKKKKKKKRRSRSIESDEEPIEESKKKDKKKKKNRSKTVESVTELSEEPKVDSLTQSTSELPTISLIEEKSEDSIDKESKIERKLRSTKEPDEPA